MHAKRSLGQHFLVDRRLQKRIVGTLETGPDDEVLEIGPGRGALTSHLGGRVRRLVLVELDRNLAARLRERYAGQPDVVVIEGDVLATPIAPLAETPAALKVVGNIPYNITSPLLFHLLERPRPALIVLMVQREVADRLVADPGTHAYGALAVGARSVASVKRMFDVPRGAFRPVPGVDSAVVRVLPFDPPLLNEAEEARLRILTRAAFQWRRKQTQKILRDHPDLSLPLERVRVLEERSGFELTRRPETFSPADFILLSRLLAGEVP